MLVHFASERKLFKSPDTMSLFIEYWKKAAKMFEFCLQQKYIDFLLEEWNKNKQIHKRTRATVRKPRDEFRNRLCAKSNRRMAIKEMKKGENNSSRLLPHI